MPAVDSDFRKSQYRRGRQVKTWAGRFARGTSWRSLPAAAWPGPRLAAPHQRTPITLKLGREGVISGQLVDPAGKPIAGAKVRVTGIDPLGSKLNENGNGLNLSGSAFPLGATTNDDGRFTIHGLTRDKIITFWVDKPGHEQLFEYAATTDVPQPDFVSQIRHGGKVETWRTTIHTGEFVLTSRPTNHVLIGRVVYEADGKPAAKAHVIHNGGTTEADENGRFRVDGLVSAKLELHASAAGPESDAAPAHDSIEIPQTPREIEHTLRLPRGLVVTGRVLDAASGQGVAQALVEFKSEADAEQTTNQWFAFSRETGDDGRFRLVVPAGRGAVVLRRLPAEFPQPERDYPGQPVNRGFTREVEGRGGQTVAVADFKLEKGREMLLRVVDATGQPLKGARIEIRKPNRLPDSSTGSSDADGRFKIIGLAPDKETVVDIIDEQRSAGATIEIPEAMAGTRGPVPEVVHRFSLVLSSRSRAESWTRTASRSARRL